jgi:CheY-like chemotaxis protein/anti-anti-sigma regulatory factor
MEIVNGLKYAIIKMPEHLSVDVVDELIADFSKSLVGQQPAEEYLLDMQQIPQLNRGGLIFINKLAEVVAQAGSKLNIAGLQEPVENALRTNHVDERVPVFKALIDFEMAKEITLDAPELPVSHPEPQRVSSPTVLIIEPSMSQRANQRRCLSKFAVKSIVEMKDIPEATRRLRESPTKIDIAILDLESTTLAGIQLIRARKTISALSNTKFFITVSDSLAESTVQEALDAGATAKLRRNFNEDDLKQYIA